MAGVIQSRVRVSDEAVDQGAARVINFVGAGVVANPNVGDPSQMDITIPGGAGTPTTQQSAQAKLAVDASTTSAVYSDIVTLPLVTGAGGASRLIVMASALIQLSNANARAEIEVNLDGARQEEMVIRVFAANTTNGQAVCLRTAVLAPGAHTLKLRWRLVGVGTLRADVVSDLRQHLILTALEVTV